MVRSICTKSNGSKKTKTKIKLKREREKRNTLILIKFIIEITSALIYLEMSRGVVPFPPQITLLADINSLRPMKRTNCSYLHNFFLHLCSLAAPKFLIELFDKLAQFVVVCGRRSAVVQCRHIYVVVEAAKWQFIADQLNIVEAAEWVGWMFYVFFSFLLPSAQQNELSLGKKDGSLGMRQTRVSETGTIFAKN